MGWMRMLDANINRASEGLRVIEDISRFCLNKEVLTAQCKELRHGIRKSAGAFFRGMIESRAAEKDIGPGVSAGLQVEGKQSLHDLAAANCKRAEEALRSVEETLRAMGRDAVAVQYEQLRYALYTIEKELLAALYIKHRSSLLDTDIYCLTSEEHSRGRDNVTVVSHMLEAGVRLIQYREKSKSMLEKYRQCIRLREITAEAGAALVINDHPDLARSVCADGVHLGQDDLPVAAVRDLVGDGMAVGVSTHSPQQAMQAVRDGADYIGVGPIFRTFTKKDVCDPVGLEYLDYVVSNISLPFVAIGGIKLHNLQRVKEHGAGCVALVTEIVGAEDIRAVIGDIKSRMKGEK